MLDPLRGLAAISVLLVHTAIFSDALDDPGYGRLLAHLDIGVPFFFLLSAFLLYRPFLEARIAGTDRTTFTAYGKRRFVRIAPAYWAVLTIAAIVPGMAGAFSGNWWVYYGLLQNYPVYEPTGTCAVDPFRCGVPIAWTLSIEVFFYLTLPLFVLAMAWLGARWRGGWLRLELAVVALLTAISIVIQSSAPKGDLHTWLCFSPLGQGLVVRPRPRLGGDLGPRQPPPPRARLRRLAASQPGSARARWGPALRARLDRRRAGAVDGLPDRRDSAATSRSTCCSA